jgi:hypothetical protein
MRTNSEEWKQLERLATDYFLRLTKRDYCPKIKIKKGLSKLLNHRLGYLYKGKIIIFDWGEPTNLNTLFHELGHVTKRVFPYVKESTKQYDKDFSHELKISQGIDEAIAISFNYEGLQYLKDELGENYGIVSKAEKEFNERNLTGLPKSDKPMNIGRKIYQTLRKEKSSVFSYLYNTEEYLLLKEFNNIV